jgi:hypothetical protein
LHGAACGAMELCGCSVEKKAKEKGVPSIKSLPTT